MPSARTRPSVIGNFVKRGTWRRVLPMLLLLQHRNLLCPQNQDGRIDPPARLAQPGSAAIRASSGTTSSRRNAVRRCQLKKMNTPSHTK